MICVFSFCSADRDMALALAEHIACMDGVSGHSCVVTHPENVDGTEIMELLQSAFGSTSHLPYHEVLTGWPDGPNQCFQEAALAIFSRDDKEPWLWMEADCVPTTPKWLDIIQTEYTFHGRPILGRFEDTWNGAGKIVGRHVSGVAVYPHDLWTLAPTVRNLVKSTREYRRGSGLPPAFDVVIAPYACKNCDESLSIQNYWKSRNFREQNGEVACDFQINYGASNIVEMDAALIHGAKDFSLLDIVQRRLTECLTEEIPEITTTNAA